MRSFWIRIFVTFWLIEILIIVAFVRVTGRIDNASSLHPLSEKALHLMAFSAKEAYAAGQCDSLDPLFARFKRVYAINPYLFDSTGHPVCGEVVSQSVRGAAQSSPWFGLGHIRVARDPQLNQVEEVVAALPGTSRENTPYTFVVETSRVPSWWFRYRSPLGILGAVFLSGMVTALLAKVLVRPIGQLRRTALELASGNLRARALAGSQTSKGDEVAALVHDFNRMADQIETLVGTHKRLLRDVSHELRSPLSRLCVALELLREDTNQESMVHVARIEREADRLNRLIGRLLELSRMEAMERTRLKKDVVSLDELIGEVVANAGYEAHARGCHVRAVIIEEARVYANGELLSSAIENIVRNAIRYTDEGTQVTVTLDQRQCAGVKIARVRVRDFGPGVPEEQLVSLGRPFYRVDTARSKETGGTGLGLAIAERALRLHSGTLTLTNHPEGGLEVTIALPLVGLSLQERSEPSIDVSALI